MDVIREIGQRLGMCLLFIALGLAMLVAPTWASWKVALLSQAVMGKVSDGVKAHLASLTPDARRT